MSNIIVINKIVLFDPDQKTISGNNQVVKLSASATLCMELLIDNIGVLVTHQQCYEFAWRRFGMEPSATSLYQTISTLRRALLSAGIDMESIQTMPRRGFILSKKIEIESESQVISSLEYDSSTMNVEKDTGGIKKNIRFNNKTVLIYLATLIFIFMIAGVLFSFHSSRYLKIFHPYLKNYYGCDIFTNLDGKISDSKIKGVIDPLIGECKKKGYVYITTYEGSERTSAIFCNKNLESSNYLNCHSYYFIGGKSND